MAEQPEARDERAGRPLWEVGSLGLTAIAAVIAALSAGFACQAAQATRDGVAAQIRPILLPIDGSVTVRATDDRLTFRIYVRAAGPGYAHLSRINLFAPDDPRVYESPDAAAVPFTSYSPGYEPGAGLPISLSIEKLATDPGGDELVHRAQTGRDLTFVVWYSDIVDDRRFRTVIRVYQRSDGVWVGRIGGTHVLDGWSGGR